MNSFLFSSESVGRGHPDKVADQISDAILDECLRQDPFSRVACETLITRGLVVLAGEITTKAQLDYRDIVRKNLKEIGYDNEALGFDANSCDIITSFNEQSVDIARGISDNQGAGDQGVVIGYASDETVELMPLPISIAHRIMRELDRLRRENILPYLGLDAKTLVTVEYRNGGHPLHLHTVVLSVQHSSDVLQEEIIKDIKEMLHQIVPSSLLDDSTKIYINPTGRFVIGGPTADCGLTGRKGEVDTYGGRARHGGGALSDKDPTKVDRSGSYIARYVAKNIVAAKLAKRCEVEISYAIGIPYPLSVQLHTFGTETVDKKRLARVVPEVFDLTPKGIIEMLDLCRPLYLSTAFGGHFGREDENFSWEKTDRVEALLSALNKS